MNRSGRAICSHLHVRISSESLSPERSRMGTAPKLASTLFAWTIWEPFWVDRSRAAGRDTLQGIETFW